MTEYRCTIVTTRDYGDSPAAGKTTTATLARIPDGTHWQALPMTFEIAVPEGTRPGGIYEMTLKVKSK
jgi:hypothetical protein